MTPPLDPEYLQRFSDVLISEIKAEMGRRDLSLRGLASLMGVNPQYVSSRLGGGNPRTGKRVELTISDLAALADAMGLDPIDLVRRAREIAESSDNVVVGRFGRTDSSAPASTVSDEELYDEPSAAEPERRDDGKTDDDERA